MEGSKSAHEETYHSKCMARQFEENKTSFEEAVHFGGILWEVTVAMNIVVT